MKRSTLPVLAAAVLAALALAADAPSSVYVDDQKVAIHTSGTDFDGTIDWWVDEATPEPYLSGTLEISKSAGTCARMRLEYQSSTGVALRTTYGGEVCAGDNAKHQWSVSLGGYTSNKLGKVKVAVQHRNSNGSFATIGSETHVYPTLSESFTITASGLDFGGDLFALGVPTGKGHLDWKLSGGQVTPQLTGTLHIDNAAGACGRMRLTYMTATGTTLDRAYSTTRCATDNRHHEWAVALGPFGDRTVGKVKVTLQSIATNGSVLGLGSKTYTYGTVPR